MLYSADVISIYQEYSMKYIFTFFLFITTLYAQKVELEILGSGGPELDGYASSSYVLWVDNKAKLLIDMGSGSMLRFEESGAKLEDLEAVVLTHLHIDHSVELPSFVKAGYFTSRQQSLEIIAPYGNDSFPSIDEFLQKLFGINGVYKYMHDVLTPQSDSFELIPVEINAYTKKEYTDFSLELINVYHGIVPALALRINVDGKSIVISGDTNNKNKHLDKITKDADLLIAHHAITSHAGRFAKTLHMEPDEIARIASRAKVKKVVLSHRMKRTRNHETESLKVIQGIYKGKVLFAEDKMKIKL